MSEKSGRNIRETLYANSDISQEGKGEATKMKMWLEEYTTVESGT